MSLQWTLIATLMYSEIAVIMLMMLPIISAKRWRQLLKSRFLLSIEAHSSIYFYGLFMLLLLAFLDSIREMRKYTGEHDAEHDHGQGHLDSQMQLHMKLFRAQRNFFISGFTLLLFLVMKKIASLISTQAMLEASNEASMKQAQAATDVANKLIDEKEKEKKNDKESKDNVGNQELEKKETTLRALREELEQTKDDLKYAKADRESMKSQAESVTVEYDRLMSENQNLQDTINELKGTSKKDE